MTQPVQRMTFQSPYRRGADDGFLFGLYLSALFFASVFSARIPLLGLLSLGLAVAVPAVVYRMMARYDRAMGKASAFAVTWMHGVMTFVCGALISGALLTVYMRWLDPGFIASQMRVLAGLEGQFPGSSIDYSAVLAAQMLEANFLPSAISVAAELMMLTVFTGSCLCMLLSAFLAHRRARRGTPEPPRAR